MNTEFYLGLDLGQTKDYAALSIVEKTVKTPGLKAILATDDEIVSDVGYYEVRDLKRWQIGTPYPNIVREVAALCERPPLPGCTLCVDHTGVGRPVVDMLRQSKLPANIVPITITAGMAITHQADGWHVAKQHLVGAMQVVLQQNRLTVAQVTEREQLIKELRSFRVKINVESKALSFEAWQEKDHDDCMPAGTLIRTRTGMKPIEAIQVGEEVLTHLGRFKHVLKVGSRYADVVYKIDATGRPPICVTDNHRFLTRRRLRSKKVATEIGLGKGNWWKHRDENGRYEKTDVIAGVRRRAHYKLEMRLGQQRWVCVKDGVNLLDYWTTTPVMEEMRDVETIDLFPTCPDTYRDQDGVLVATTYNGTRINPKQNRIARYLTVDADFLLMVGYYFAEGCSKFKGNGLAFASHEREQPLRDKVGAYLRGLGLNPTEFQSDAHGYVLQATSRPLGCYFQQFGKFAEKRLPDWVSYLPPEKQWPVLLGYLLGDGCFADERISANTISPTAAAQLYEIALRLGLPCRMRRQPSRKGGHEQWALSFSRSAAAKIKSKIEPQLLECKLQNGSRRQRTSDQTCMRFVDGALVGKIRKVTPVEHRDLVYNLEVADDNSYVAEGTAVHNCVISLALPIFYAERNAGPRQGLRIYRFPDRGSSLNPKYVLPKVVVCPKAQLTEVVTAQPAIMVTVANPGVEESVPDHGMSRLQATAHLRFADRTPDELKGVWTMKTKSGIAVPDLLMSRGDGKRFWSHVLKKHEPATQLFVIVDEGGKDRRAMSLAMALCDVMRFPREKCLFNAADPETKQVGKPGNEHVYELIRSTRHMVM